MVLWKIPFLKAIGKWGVRSFEELHPSLDFDDYAAILIPVFLISTTNGFPELKSS